MKIFWRIVRYIKPYSAKFALHIITMIIGITLYGVSISFMKSIMDFLFKDNSEATIRSLENSPFKFLDSLNSILVNTIQNNDKATALGIAVLIIIILYITGQGLKYVAQLLMNSIRTNVIKNLRMDLFSKVNKLQIQYFEGERKGDIMTRFTADLVNVEESIMTTIESLVKDPYTIFLFIFLMITASPSLTLYIFILLPPMAILVTLIGKSLKKNSRKSQERLSLINSVIDEFTTGIRVIKAFNAGNYITGIFKGHNDGYRKQSKKVLNKNRAIPIISESLGVITVSILIFFSGKLVFEGKIDGSLIILFVLLFQQISQPAKKISQAYGNIMKGAASGERIFNLMDSKILIKDKENAVGINAFQNSIQIRNLNFAYQNDLVLKNINLEIPKGKTFALVGQSGSGKTTLAELVLRFYDIKSGEILVDGINIKDLKIFDLRELMAVVTQEPILFNDTIYNNIAFGLKDVKEENIIAAAKAANAHDFIIETENGYETNIGDRGALLSGGQRQRLSIARAILRNPPILILDEATSSLDTASEKMVQDALERLMENRTSIVIAHRLSTIQKADQILVMDKGEIIETGTHQELIVKNGMYKKLYELQQL